MTLVGKNKEDKWELTKQTFLIVNWVKKSNRVGSKVTYKGSRLPKEVKRMVAQRLLDELGVRIHLD